MRNHVAIAIVTLFALIGCKHVTSVPPESDFTLAVGQSVRIADSDITLGLVAVAGDSRCPVDVVCVHAGNAEVKLEARGRSGGQLNLVVNTDREPRAASFENYSIVLVSLLPAPRSTQPIRSQDYRARLHLTRTTD